MSKMKRISNMTDKWKIFSYLIFHDLYYLFHSFHGIFFCQYSVSSFGLFHTDPRIGFEQQHPGANFGVSGNTQAQVRSGLYLSYSKGYSERIYRQIGRTVLDLSTKPSDKIPLDVGKILFERNVLGCRTLSTICSDGRACIQFQMHWQQERMQIKCYGEMILNFACIVGACARLDVSETANVC